MSENARKVRPRGVGLPVRLTGDRALANRISGGDPAAFDEMFRRYHQPIYRFCSAMVGPEEAKDMLQNVMTKAITSLPDNEGFQMKPWLYRVARNECVDQLRQAGRAASGFDPDSRSDDFGRNDPHRVAEQREQLGWLVEDLNDLPEKQRVALIMRELSGLGYEEIAASTGSTESGAKQLVYEARLSLEQADLGRRLDCEEVRRSISSHDRRRLRGRKVRSHLRSCRGCSDFEQAIAGRQAGFRSLFPALPLGASLGLLDALHAGGAASGVAGAGSFASGSGGVLAGGVATSAIAKGAVVLAVAGGVGAGTAKVVHDRQETKPPVERSATVPQLADPVSPGRAATENRDVTRETAGPARNPGADQGERSRQASDRQGGGEVANRESAERRAPDAGQGKSDAPGRITPANGVGQGPATHPEASVKGQARAQEASGTKPGQTGSAPPSKKPASPPGQSSTGGSGKYTGGSTTTSQGKADSAPAVGRPESPGNSGK